MKHPILRYGVALLTLSLAATTIAAADPDTLFPSNQWGVSIFGEYDTGDIHLSNTPGTETHTTTFHYTIPAPPTGVISVSVRSASRTAAAAPLKPAASHTPAATIDPTVTTTHTHHYHFNDVEHNPGGGGVQLSYYFSRYAGVAVEGDFLGGSTYLTQLSGQFILRYPFEFGRTSIAGYSKDAKDVRTDSKDSKDYKSAPSEMSGPTWGVARTPSLAVVANGTAAWSASRMSAAVLNFASRSAGESSPMPAGTSATAASISLRSRAGVSYSF